MEPRDCIVLHFDSGKTITLQKNHHRLSDFFTEFIEMADPDENDNVTIYLQEKYFSFISMNLIIKYMDRDPKNQIIPNNSQIITNENNIGLWENNYFDEIMPFFTLVFKDFTQLPIGEICPSSFFSRWLEIYELNIF